MEHAYFDRFDICYAHALLEYHYHIGGIVRERLSNNRRNMSTGYQLHRMGFRPSPLFDFYYENLSDNAKAIYNNLVQLYGFYAEEHD